jgi:hypothetical protein
MMVGKGAANLLLFIISFTRLVLVKPCNHFLVIESDGHGDCCLAILV